MFTRPWFKASTVVTYVFVLISVHLCAILPARAQNLIVNGGFETPVVPDPTFFLRFFGGESFDGWEVGGESIDIHGPLHTEPRLGSQSLDLSGLNLPGSIFQTITTIPGQTYELEFWLAGHPFHTDPNPNKILDIFWGGTLAATKTIAPSLTRFPMNWRLERMTLTATSPTTELRFVSRTLNGGPIIDGVSLSATAPEPSSYALFIVGLLISGITRSRLYGCSGNAFDTRSQFR